MLVVPLAPMPTFVLLFVQLIVPPAGVVVKFSANTVAPLHTVWLPPDALTVGIGLIVMLKEPAVPAQPPKVGVTEIVPTC